MKMRVTNKRPTISDIVAENMKKPRIMLIEKGQDPSTYNVFTMFKGNNLKFNIGLISKIGMEWVCFFSYDNKKEIWYKTLRDCKAHFQSIVDNMNAED